MVTETRQGTEMQADPKSVPSAHELAARMEEADALPGLEVPVEDLPPSAGGTAGTPKVRQSDAPYCMQCGVQMVRAGSCHACPSCGSTSGCS
jgi:ribonucleoside-diphosphate reductase alpha chain